MILLLLVVGISVGYAALTTTLNINGSTTIEKASWDIHFENLVKSDGTVPATMEASIDSTKTLIEYTVMLTKPGDYYEFTVDMVNKGTIDAMISEVLKEGLSTEQEKYIEYTATYSDGVELEEKDYLKSGETQNIKVRVKYREDITAAELPTEETTLNLKFQVTYIQADETAKERKKRVCKVTSGSGTNVGDVITCDTENFYVISYKNSTIKMLAKYNLYVGGSYNFETHVYTEYGNEATGLQNEKMLGFVRDETESFGTTRPEKSTSYINNYVQKLEVLGINIVGGDSISLDELLSLGCVYPDYANATCLGAEPWLYSTSYWTGTEAVEDTGYYMISSDGDIDINGGRTKFGIRPVVTISASEIGL